MSPRPPFVVRSLDVSEVESAYPAPFDTEKLSLGRDLGSAAGSRALGVWRERLLPGRRTSFTHAHLREEEVIYVLSGAPTLRWIPPGEPVASEVPLAAGDCVSFPAGTGIAHTFVNRSDADAELLVVGERRPSERIHYPEDLLWAGWADDNNPQRAWSGDRPSELAKPPAVRIRTERLVLRTWRVEDAGDLLAAQRRNQEHLRTWMPWARELPTVDEMADRIASWATLGDLVYGVFEPDGRIVGGTGVHPRVGEGARELGYWVAANRQGRGYVTEWCAALVALCFRSMGLDRVEIHCSPENVRSAAVPKRLGFHHEATLPRRVVGADGQPRDSMIWATYRSEWGPERFPAIQAWDRLDRRLL